MTQIYIESITKKYKLKGRNGIMTALDKVSFSVGRGETVGIIGRNGSGKSTLLKIISGVTAPTSGKIKVNGRVSALLELGAGFNPEYTGIENIYLNGSINGLTRKETEQRIPEILDFADIGSFADQPVKTYSDGMFVRLAFAAAVCSVPDILAVDEALAVGDFMFRSKCFKKLEELKKKGVTILYVTHDIDSVRKFCSRAVWLEKGRIVMDGDVTAVSSAYMENAVCGGMNRTKSLTMINRFGSDIGTIEAVECKTVWKLNEEIAVKVRFKVPSNADLENTAVSLAVKNGEGLDLLVLRSGNIKGLRCGETAEAVFRFKNLLCRGEYALAAGIERPADIPVTYYDYCEGIVKIHAEDADENFGVFHTEAVVEINGEAKT